MVITETADIVINVKFSYPRPISFKPSEVRKEICKLLCTPNPFSISSKKFLLFGNWVSCNFRGKEVSEDKH